MSRTRLDKPEMRLVFNEDECYPVPIFAGRKVVRERCHGIAEDLLPPNYLQDLAEATSNLTRLMDIYSKAVDEQLARDFPGYRAKDSES